MRQLLQPLSKNTNLKDIYSNIAVCLLGPEQALVTYQGGIARIDHRKNKLPAQIVGLPIQSAA